jgi:small subunit ribosomal protein S14
MKAREVKRAKLVAKYAAKRAAFKKVIATAEDPMEAYEAARSLQAIPANANPIRLHNRCKITGRPRGFMRQFGLSRIQFREMASAGLIPGVKKASW